MSASTIYAADVNQTPNVIIFFADDMAYADIGAFGAQGYATPHLDQLAADGKKFTSFYVAQAVCSASRAALLTGCYPNRVGISGALGPSSKIGINADEFLLPEIMKQQGYRTCIVGKWHLGHHPQFLPTRHGFDTYFGLPYSNDMWPLHPENKTFPPLPLFQDEQIVDADIDADDQKTLTQRYTDYALQFMEQQPDQPYFLYVAYSMPHVPLFVSAPYADKSSRGLFGDVIQEIDASVGRVLKKVEEQQEKSNTLVIFTSDNGPWLSYGDHAGSARPLKEGKGTSWEGGVRVPMLASWPGKIQSGTVCDETAATIDLLPTLAHLTGAELPAHKIDGVDISNLLFHEGTTTPHEAYYYYWGNALEAVRSGEYKLVFPHTYRSCPQPGTGGIPGKYVQLKTDLALYNLKTDIGETTDIKDQHPEIVTRLQKYAEQMRAQLGDGKIKPSASREPGKISP
jgi:arylsulfatase